MNIDLEAVYAGKVSYADIIGSIRHDDLYHMTDELFDTLESILVEAIDATVFFVPRDTAASDQSGDGWTLSHVIVHLTATSEEAAATAAMLARGVQVEGRLRYETPWQDLSTLQMLQARLQESRRICRAFLDVWPNEPHLDVTMTLNPLIGPMDAVGLYVFGIAHAQEHFAQLRDIVRQYTSSQFLQEKGSKMGL